LSVHKHFCSYVTHHFLFSIISEKVAALSSHRGYFLCCHCSNNNVGTSWH